MNARELTHPEKQAIAATIRARRVATCPIGGGRFRLVRKDDTLGPEGRDHEGLYECTCCGLLLDMDEVPR